MSGMSGMSGMCVSRYEPVAFVSEEKKFREMEKLFGRSVPRLRLQSLLLAGFGEMPNSTATPKRIRMANPQPIPSDMSIYIVSQPTRALLCVKIEYLRT
jgi:hypothetical protein